MRSLSPTILPALAAAAVVPLLAAAGPASASPATVPSPDTAASPVRDPAEILRSLERGARHLGNPRGLAAASGVGPASHFYVSYPGGATVVEVDPDTVPQSATPTTNVTAVSFGPAGDSSAFSPLTGTPRTRVQGTTGGHRDYPLSDEPVAWGPFGDGFVAHVGGSYVVQYTNPDFSEALEVPDGATSPAVTPYGGSVLMHVPTAGGGSDIVAVPSPLSGSATLVTDMPLGLGAWSPQAPAVGQAPGAGVERDVDGATYVAFLGHTGGGEATTRRLYVDQQTSTTESGYGDPIDVADAGYACDVAAPAFTPDRRRLAFVRSLDPACTSFEVRTVGADVDGSYPVSAPTTLLWSSGPDAAAPTVLSWRAQNPGALPIRVDGGNRYDVAANVAGFYEEHASDGVVLAGGQAYPDALTGGPLAVRLGGPMLLTPANTLSDAAAWAIDYTLRPGGTVYVLGGTHSVSSTVVRQLENAGYLVERIPGANRYEVAVNVADTVDAMRGSKPTAAFVSSGTAFADALVAGPAASLVDGPVLLSRGDTLPDVTKGYLAALGDDADVYAIGGSGVGSVQSDPRTIPVLGANRYDVAGNVAQTFFPWSRIAAVADGRNWPDAASGGTLMAAYQEPILLTNGRDTLPGQTAEYLYQTRASADYLLAFGGLSSVPQGAFAAASAATGQQTTYYGPDTSTP